MKLKEFIQKSRLRPWDIGIILLLVASSFLPLVIFGWQQEETNAAAQEAVLKVAGEEVRRFDLKADQKTYTYKYEDEDGDYNLIEISGGQIRIKEANCGDQVCVRRGWISRAGESIVCLPHKLVIEVQASDGSEPGSVIY
ncbi:hypothetical protein RU97_GL002354 [Enterococcus canis]|uniref:Uncharacterized protein n=1 Tax=Enterococcus canis TaxID=214095 RepID=A0A1L8RDI4_9ENTE|nr:NusG domain II-containing protein [Enterococcus canis]OJG17808.1 hypothetical protein RU97_GL002354 [Enterococcus canis]